MPTLSERQLPLRIETLQSCDEIIEYDGLISHRAICHFLFERLEVHTPNLSILYIAGVEAVKEVDIILCAEVFDKPDGAVYRTATDLQALLISSQYDKSVMEQGPVTYDLGFVCQPA